MLLAAGAGAWFAGARPVADALWFAATLVGLAQSSVSLAGAVRQRRPSVDVIAWLALVGALVVGEALAGALIALMLAGGVLLEARAAARARRELSLLAARAPRTARRYGPDGLLELPADQVGPGDRLLVGSGEIVPVDGRLLGPAVLDESALTGEPLPVDRPAGDDVRSGVVNAGTPFDLVATASAGESTYAGIVRLAEQAQAAGAPFVRAADRAAVVFVPLTLVLAGAAWLVSGDVVRAVAVLVVATPCPLLLAVPIAIMSGLSRAARSGVVIKGGAALERLAAGRLLLFDKTGTLTHGRPRLAGVVTAGEPVDADEVLRLAGSLDQASAHVLAGAIVSAARERGLRLEPPVDVREEHGYGVRGLVGGHEIRLGKASWTASGPAPGWMQRTRRRAELEGLLTVFLSRDARPAGALLFEDPIRADAPRMVRALRTAGIERVVLVTGDRDDVARAVGRIVGVDTVHADQDPAGKLAIVRQASATAPTIMVGDGINDAPALAAAGTGVALAARGATASAEAADIVLTVDRIDALADAILIARRARRIAWLAVIAGMGLSVTAMLAAAAGLLPPAAGALLQEVIDVAAIGIALTALVPVRAYTRHMTAADLDTARRLYAQHRSVEPVVEQVRDVADALAQDGTDLAPLRAVLGRLEGELLPHERAEEAELVPIMAKALGGADPTGAISRTHAEIEHYIDRLARTLDDPGDDTADLQRLLYGLYAILRLHNAQEEEAAFSMLPPGGPEADRN
ncbi:heavy metal translocating P-type ATPase [Paractinoplanes rishiriensis]|uniref:ATPase P n=1 Tax=Paractinoplanes rishiriensis TaxID=1050105 RepID=A0A919K6Y8_9ACTN|nr:ATPase P [Actinoplanes rishiriensis]